MTRKQLIAFRILFILYLAVVLFLCFGNFKDAPSSKLEIGGIGLDKVLHFCMFLPFPVLAYLAFDPFTGTVPQTLLFVGAAFVAGLLFAAGTEWGQANLTTYRDGDPMDLLADSLAILTGSILTAFWDIRKQKK